MTQAWIIWGSELSPFTLKSLALAQCAQLPHRFLPAHGSLREKLHYAWRLERLKRGKLPLSWPAKTALDEYPLVPFFFGPRGENAYDSTAFADWLDANHQQQFRPNHPSIAFLNRLLDEYANAFMLYLVHHNRWKVSAASNNAGERVAAEFIAPFAPAKPLFSRWFSARQVRRLPYLFSVAPAGFNLTGVTNKRQPPSRNGFPATHDLLENAFAELLAALEPIFNQRPFLFGDQFTLADASVYGQLAMNLTDPDANAWIKRDAPVLHAWLSRIYTGNFSAQQGSAHHAQASLELFDDLTPLLALICQTYVPLMQQNHAAYTAHVTAGETVFNEAAFNQHRALFDGALDGQAFRSVAKSFQVKTWQQVHTHWQSLDAATQTELANYLPTAHGLGNLSAAVKIPP